MKLSRIVLIVCLALLPENVFCQLIADAGRDTFFCTGPSDTIILGGNPTAKNGVPPYKYKWNNVIRDKELNILDWQILINDSNANPKYAYTSSNDCIITLYVQVTDANKQEVHDSLNIYISGISSVHILTNDYIIEKGDTCQIGAGNVFQGFPPRKYRWTPVYNISEPTARFPEVWPAKNTSYIAEVIDSFGCIGKDYIDVQVNGGDKIANITKNNDFNISQIPLTNESQIENKTNIKSYKLCIYTVQGSLIFDRMINKNNFEIGKIIINPGVYLINIQNGNKVIYKNVIVRAGY
jgi:hypothetical protein